MKELISKYNIPVPRYTSYPTVPNWKVNEFDSKTYQSRFLDGFHSANRVGLSLYIHLPYCESLCTYCGCNTRITVNHKVEIPYIDALLKEFDLLFGRVNEEPLIREIHLGGGTPTFFSAENLELLVSGILSRSRITDDASFSFEAHPANTSSNHLKRLRRLGFDRLSLGIQDFSPKVQKAINRRQEVSDVLRVVDEARTLGYRSINFDLIYGLPFQTLASTKETIQKVIRMRPDRIAYYSYAHVPWMRPGQRAYSESDLPSPALKQLLFTEGRAQLLDEGYEAIGFDHFALPGDSLFTAYREGRMHRNFMGFSDLKTPYQIGLGVSSISDIGNGFAQNAKSVEAYMEALGAGRLPLVKGHLHSSKDSMIRKHILNLTCKHKTSWYCAPKEEQIYMRRCLNRLDEQFKDGLVSNGLDRLEITPTGRFFVRQICSAFDEFYEDQKVEMRYSSGI